ncbi:MAG TPA: glycine oxidase ThiO [Terriglobales bacterium]|nr:glycine oxidase ThiO [Terriglobales bacterium]
MRHADVVVLGAGVIGLSLARELHKQGAAVRVVERGRPGHESSYAAAGMLAVSEPAATSALQALKRASDVLYAEFVHEIEDESGMRVDLRRDGTLFFGGADELAALDVAAPLVPLAVREIHELEPRLEPPELQAVQLPDRSVDPRALVAALTAAVRHRGVALSTGAPATGIWTEQGRIAGVTFAQTRFPAAAVVNCCGAWAGQLGPHRFPTRPVKGQMLAVAMRDRRWLGHIVRTPEVYLVPRSDGRLLIGATVEEAGFDKRVEPATIQRLRDTAVRLLPALRDVRILEAWAGLRPGTPDRLPILGETATPGYFVATGHFRDGILLAPATAQVMAEMLTGKTPSFDLGSFSPRRFEG